MDSQHGFNSLPLSFAINHGFETGLFTQLQPIDFSTFPLLVTIGLTMISTIIIVIVDFGIIVEQQLATAGNGVGSSKGKGVDKEVGICVVVGVGAAICVDGVVITRGGPI